jgi:hypothetical protein
VQVRRCREAKLHGASLLCRPGAGLRKEDGTTGPDVTAGPRFSARWPTDRAGGADLDQPGSAARSPPRTRSSGTSRRCVMVAGNNGVVFWRTWSFLAERLEQLREGRQMTMSISRMIEQKRHYRQYKARIEQLPASYRTAVARVGAVHEPPRRAWRRSQHPVDAGRPCRPLRAGRGRRNPGPRDRRGGPRGVRRGLPSQLPGGSVDHPRTGAADPLDRARRRRSHRNPGRSR